MNKKLQDKMIKGLKFYIDLTRRHKNPVITKEISNAMYEEALINMNMPVYTKGITLKDSIHIKVNGVICTVYLILNPYVLKLHNLQIANVYTDTVNQIVIFVDETYLRLSDNTANFIFWHEIGHIKLNHDFSDTTGNKRLLGIAKGELDHRELEADLFASKMLKSKTKGIAAIIELEQTTHGLARKELRKRALALKGEK